MGEKTMSKYIHPSLDLKKKHHLSKYDMNIIEHIPSQHPIQNHSLTLASNTFDEIITKQYSMNFEIPDNDTSVVNHSKELLQEPLNHTKFFGHEGEYMPPLYDLSGNEQNLSDHGFSDTFMKTDKNMKDSLVYTNYPPQQNNKFWGDQTIPETNISQHSNSKINDEINIEFGNSLPNTQTQIPKLPFPLSSYFKSPQDFQHKLFPTYGNGQVVHTQPLHKSDKTKTYNIASHFATEYIDCIDSFVKLSLEPAVSPDYDHVSDAIGSVPQLSLFGPNGSVRHTMFYKTMIPFDCGKPGGHQFDINLNAVRGDTGIDLLNDCFIVFPKKIEIKCIYLYSDDINQPIDKIQGELLPILQSLKYENCYDNLNDDEYIVPLPFFFKKSSSAFPLVATSQSSLNLKIITHTPMDNIGNIKLIASGIYLSITERQRFIDLTIETIITQWGMNHIKANLPDIIILDGEEFVEKTIYIPINSFSSCVSQMFIKVFTENEEYVANMNGTILKCGKPFAFIDSTINKLNFAKYNVTHIPKNTYVIPFCIYPDIASQQSSGFVRMSNDMAVKLTFKFSSQCIPKKMNVHVWCPRYNILRIRDDTFSV
jgi:hypothetical protein